MIKLVTGSTGTNHITAADDGALHAALVGEGLVIFNTGACFAASVINSTTVRVSDGEGLIDGRHFRLRPGETEELALSDGVAGFNRVDLVALHYVNSGGVESIALEVLEGDYSEGEASDPAYPRNDDGILGGALEYYAPLYRLSREGINPPTLEQLFDPAAVPKLSELQAVADMVYPVGSIYMSVNPANPGALFGGMWERIKDTFLLSAGDTYAAGETGGEAEHILTVGEMPSHKHPTYNGDGWALFEMHRDGTVARTQVAASSSSKKYTFTATDSNDIQWPYNGTYNAGGGAAHNNMPPYLTVYMWKRTA